MAAHVLGRSKEIRRRPQHAPGCKYAVTKVAATGDSMHGVKTQSLARSDITVPDARPEADCSRLLAVQSRPEQHKSAVMALDQYLAASLIEQSTSQVLFPGRRRRIPLIAAAVTLKSKVLETARVTTSMSLKSTKRMSQISTPRRRLARLLPGYVNMEGRITCRHVTCLSVTHQSCAQDTRLK